MANFPLGDTQQVSFAVSSLDADKNPAVAQPGDIITVVSSAPASIIVVLDATPAAGSVVSGTLLGTAILATGVAITATVAHVDGTSATGTDILDVVGGEGETLAFALGTPVQQPPAAAPIATANAALKPKA
jgi:hypothetical protein